MKAAAQEIAKEIAFQRQLIAHFRKRAAEHGPDSTSAKLLAKAIARGKELAAERGSRPAHF